ncbi:Hypothetical predicted protein [Cloeon dipterum]|uniref:Kazal-like domain-containing protein n=1 Tax=Cloeon dipterum TaxID=197152 RepID=A0A8S1DRP6_9INSE|nr:Hypothetical predicted protein [Cloeon dipterum]
MKFALVCFVACMVLVGATAKSISGDCNWACLAVYRPVCGKNSKGETRTFSNDCYMAGENCDGQNDFVKVKDGEC